MIKSNLEPIEEGDLDIESKFKMGPKEKTSEQATPFAIEKEVPRETIAAENDDSYGKILSKVQAQASDNDIDPNAVASDAQIGSQKMDAQSKVQHLIDIAQQKGVIHAVKVAQHMQDNYVLDTMHDRMLGDQLHDALVKKGMIKEL